MAVNCVVVPEFCVYQVNWAKENADSITVKNPVNKIRFILHPFS